MHNEPFLSTPLFHLLILRESVYLSGTIPGYHLAILSLVFLFFPFPSIDPSITLFIFRSFSILHMCPNRLSFLHITTFTRSSLTSSLLLISLFLILSKRFTCNIHLSQYISKTNNAVLSAFLNVH